jgi:hypothetical protein
MPMCILRAFFRSAQDLGLGARFAVNAFPRHGQPIIEAPKELEKATVL